MRPAGGGPPVHAGLGQLPGPGVHASIINDLRILSWAAERFGKADDAARYAAQMEKVKTEGMQSGFWPRSTGRPCRPKTGLRSAAQQACPGWLRG